MNLNGFPSPQRWIRFMGVPFSNANRIRFIEASTLSRWPSSPSGWDSPPRGPPPSLQRMGFASRGSPSLSPRGSLPQVDEILLKGLPSPQRMGFASRESPSQQQMGFASRGSSSPREWDSHQEGHSLQSEWDSHQEGHPLQSEWDSHQKGHPLQSNGIRIKRVTLFKANGIRF